MTNRDFDVWQRAIAFLPRGIPHASRVLPDEFPALIMASPAGIEDIYPKPGGIFRRLFGIGGPSQRLCWGPSPNFAGHQSQVPRRPLDARRIVGSAGWRYASSTIATSAGLTTLEKRYVTYPRDLCSWISGAITIVAQALARGRVRLALGANVYFRRSSRTARL